MDITTTEFGLETFRDVGNSLRATWPKKKFHNPWTHPLKQSLRQEKNMATNGWGKKFRIFLRVLLETRLETLQFPIQKGTKEGEKFYPRPRVPFRFIQSLLVRNMFCAYRQLMMTKLMSVA